MYIEDLKKSLPFKRDMLKETLIKQTDVTTFDNSVVDVYKSLIKSEKIGLVETTNKSNFQVNINK